MSGGVIHTERKRFTQMLRPKKHYLFQKSKFKILEIYTYENE